MRLSHAHTRREKKARLFDCSLGARATHKADDLVRQQQQQQYYPHQPPPPFLPPAAIAESLNNTLIGGRKRNYYHDDMWNLKYLRKFKWDHLTEKVAYERRVRSQKLRLETMQAKR